MNLSDFQQNIPLAPYTTLKIGGPAQYLAIATKQSELFELLKFLHQNPHLPQTILGLGSNVVISDSGLKGLTIINKATQIKITGNSELVTDNFQVTNTQRQENEPEKYLDFNKIDYDESIYSTQEVLIQAGTPLPYAINHLFTLGLTGLQWFSYIPSTIGGAVYQNIHGGKYHFSDYIGSVKVFDLTTGKTKLFRKEELTWQYETSYFQQHPNLIILSVRLRLFKGDVNLAKQVSTAWIAQKSLIQPMNSSGSTFANPSLNDCLPIWGEQKSAGWIIDHELNLKGFHIGDAQISTLHSNFFVNTGHATATDYKKLVEHVQNAVYNKFKIKLIPEVKFLGEF
ncbi:MAG: FAD-binding protein [Microgenomates group bacterium]